MSRNELARFEGALCGTTTFDGAPKWEPETLEEFQKVGEVVEEMGRIGREECVVEMGIGSFGSNNSV